MISALTLQTLDRCDARLALGIHRFVARELCVDWRNTPVLIALSGGVDSTALLILLQALRGYRRGEVSAAHLDHGLRPESADDATACEALCAQLGVPFYLQRVDVAARAAHAGTGLEEEGRKARYEFLEQVRRRVGASWVLTAHQADDLAEDILLRLTRGTAWPGLGGMRAVDEERRLLRPLLMVEKKQLVAMLERLGITWREDASNEGRLFRRNRIRHDVLPRLKEENPDFIDAARQLWRSARLDEAYWDEKTAGVPRPVAEGLLLPEGALRALPKAGRLRACVMGIRSLGVGQARASTLFELDDAWKQRRRGRCFYFPGGICATVTAEGVLLCVPAQSI